ncbi:MAG TPA: DUF2934 domain-containing protein [Steroidobacteraceae bacterium]
MSGQPDVAKRAASKSPHDRNQQRPVEVAGEDFRGRTTPTSDKAAERSAVEFDEHINTDAARRERIAIAAYYLAERRGFAPGVEMEDWLAAEAALEGSAPTR